MLLYIKERTGREEVNWRCGQKTITKGFEWHIKELKVIKEDHSQICFETSLSGSCMEEEFKGYNTESERPTG